MMESLHISIKDHFPFSLTLHHLYIPKNQHYFVFKPSRNQIVMDQPFKRAMQCNQTSRHVFCSKRRLERTYALGSCAYYERVVVLD